MAKWKVPDVSGAQLAAARKKWNITQEQLEELWQVRRTYISRMENAPKLSRAWAILATTLHKKGPSAFK